MCIVRLTEEPNRGTELFRFWRIRNRTRTDFFGSGSRFFRFVSRFSVFRAQAYGQRRRRAARRGGRPPVASAGDADAARESKPFAPGESSPYRETSELLQDGGKGAGRWRRLGKGRRRRWKFQGFAALGFWSLRGGCGTAFK
jgi:hypothetical protein